jgi:signal transduction histidine kinase
MNKTKFLLGAGALLAAVSARADVIDDLTTKAGDITTFLAVVVAIAVAILLARKGLKLFKSFGG